MNSAQPSNHWLSLMLAAVVLLTSAIAPTESSAAESGNESIGDVLLDDLDPNRFDPPAAPDESQPARPNSRKHILPGVLDDELAAGVLDVQDHGRRRISAGFLAHEADGAMAVDDKAVDSGHARSKVRLHILLSLAPV